MLRPYTSMEAENRAAFLVQLNVHLTQLDGVVKTLSGANQSKMEDLSTILKEWQSEVGGSLNAPRPSIVTAAKSSSPPQQRPSSDKSKEKEEDKNKRDKPREDVSEARNGNSEAAPEGENAQSPKETSNSENKSGDAATSNEREESRETPHNDLGDRDTKHTSATVDSTTQNRTVDPPATAAAAGEGGDEVSSTEFGSKNVNDLVELIKLLFASGIPEFQKFQAIGKSLIRLVMVRCFSTLTAALQHVSYLTYGSEKVQRSGREAELETFTVLSKDIRRSSVSVASILQLISFHSDLNDVSRVRYGVQTSVDALRQVKRSMLYFQTRMEKEELNLLRHNATAARQPTAEYVSSRAATLRELWGPSLADSIANVGSCMETAVRFLVQAAALDERSASPDLQNVKKDVENDLISLSDLTVKSLTSPAGATTAATNGNNATASSPLGDGLESADIREPEVSSSALTNSNILFGGRAPEAKIKTRCVLYSVGFSYIGDYLACMSKHCGDENDGTIAATRVVSECLAKLAKIPGALPCIIAGEWKKSILNGILNCVLSPHPVVLGTGLRMLTTVVTLCIDVISEEVGYIYSDALFRLLESDNCLDYIKREIVFHFLYTFLRPSPVLTSYSPTTIPRGNSYNNVANDADNSNNITSTATTTNNVNCKDKETPAQDREDDYDESKEELNQIPSPPLLLRLYCSYDLNINSHHLNIAQQFISALSRIVRRSHAADFINPEEPGATNTNTSNASIPASSSSAATSEATKNGATPSTATSGDTLQNKTLPFIALHGLMTAIELVGTQILPEDWHDGNGTPLDQVTKINLRDVKLERQRLVDLVNDSPKKALKKIFGITEEEMDPPDVDEKFKKEFDHNYLPEPKSESTKAKIKAVTDFLFFTTSLSPEAVSELITTPSVFPLQVCMEYMSRLNLAGRGVVMALKELLSTVQLPKEGQKIERLLEYFGYMYYKMNNVPGVDKTVFPFTNEDTCFVIIVATVMLNTDLHNPMVASRMTQTMFRAQLKGCDKKITPAFADSIYNSINQMPLSNISGRSSSSTLNPADAHRGLDALFISYEERRHIAFGIERQRLASQTRQLIALRSFPPTEIPKNDWRWWCGIARDFFSASWASLCAVFGPTMCEDSSMPIAVLQKSINGLQAVLKIAASFALTTECEISMVALLHMTKYEKVANTCRQAILNVASSGHSIHFSTRCWTTVLQLIASLRNDNNTTLNSKVEAVFARIEFFSRARSEKDINTEEGNFNEEKLKEAVKSILEGVVFVLRSSQSNGLSLSTGLYLLRRCLGYSVLVHDKTGADVKNCVNIKDFSDVMLPMLVTLVDEFKESGESLKAIIETTVEILSVMWKSGVLASKSYIPSNTDDGVSVKTEDKILLSFLQSCEFFKRCYLSNSQKSPPSALVKLHLLQGVKELMAASLTSVEASLTALHAHSLDTIFSAWRRILYPMAISLSEKENSSNGVSNVVVTVIKQLVVMACGTGSNSTSMIPVKVRLIALLLLSNICYIGVMCGSSLDNAQTCLTSLSSLCSTALSLDPGLSQDALEEEDDDEEEKGVGAQRSLKPSAFKDSGNLVLFMIYNLENEPQFVAKHLLERLCLLLRNEHEQVRSEVCESLRSLSLQLQPGHVVYLATLLTDIVLEGSLGWSSPHNEIPMSDPTLISFWVFLMTVPPTMKRCSRTTFRSTLLSVMGFMTDELLTATPIAETSSVAALLMERCFAPLMVSPNCTVTQVRSLAARSLSTCVAFSLKRYNPESNRFPLQSLIDCVALALFRMQTDVGRVIPPNVEFIGDEMTKPLPKHQSDAHGDLDDVEAMSSRLKSYYASSQEAIRLLGLSDPPEISGRASSALLADSSDDDDEGDAGNGKISEASKESAKRKSKSVLRTGESASGIIRDEELCEHCNTLSQLLSGLPKVLNTVRPDATCSESVFLPRTDKMMSCRRKLWKLPKAFKGAILHLLLNVLRVDFAILWRTTHPQEMQSFSPSQSLVDATTNNALMPHAAVRGALNTFIELAVQAKEYPFPRLLSVTVGLLHTVAQVQKNALSLDNANQRISNGSEQLLSPQEQQHIRTCYTGMYQELSAVLSYWLKALQQQPQAGQGAQYSNGVEHERRAELQKMALDSQLFEAFVGLLTPTAGPLIVTAKDYFGWYIEQKKIVSLQ